MIGWLSSLIPLCQRLGKGFMTLVLEMGMEWVTMVFGALSAVAWVASAVTTPVITASYWGGPPAPLVRRMKLGSLLNAAGALFAAIAIAAQAFSAWTNIPS